MVVTVAPPSTARATEAVARYACSADLRNAADELFARVTRAVIDTVGVTIAGRAEPTFSILAETIGSTGGLGHATVLPTRTRTTATQAALLNGTAGHALDYDDVADEIRGHPSVVLVSALLSLAEANGNSGREFLEAYAIGFEVACAIARGLPVEAHYTRGWHSTATVGTLAATAGAARLLRLDPGATSNALGVAASMASGSRQNFGTMTKPLHAGLAARDAVLAARLASNGFTADEQQLEGPIGYLRLYGSDADANEVVAALTHPHVLLERGLSVKKYPCCYGTHRMADAALMLREHGLKAEDVRGVKVSVQPGGLQAIIHHRPETGLQGKFSGEYVVAACLLDGAVRLSSFTDAAVNRTQAQDLLKRVAIEEAAVPPFGGASFYHAYATLEVTVADGSSLRERCDIPRGDARAPLSDAELEAKFRDCLAYSGSDWNADELLMGLRELQLAPQLSAVFTRSTP